MNDSKMHAVLRALSRLGYGAVLSVLAGAATAATLSIAGGTAKSVNTSVFIPNVPSSVIFFSAPTAGGSIGGGVQLDGPAKVRYSFVYQSAGAFNRLVDAADESVYLSNRTNVPGDFVDVLDDGGFLDFGFITSEFNNDKIFNGGTATGTDIGFGVGDITNGGKTVRLFFADLGRSSDAVFLDDLIIQVDVIDPAAVIPLPAGLPLMLTALGLGGIVLRPGRGKAA